MKANAGNGLRRFEENLKFSEKRNNE